VAQGYASDIPGSLRAVDAECLECEDITVWLAPDNLSDMTAMKVISGSHRLPVHPVQLSSSCGLDTSDDDAVVKSARELDSTCELKILKAKPGEFFIFFGRVWHSIRNRHNARAVQLRFSTPPREQN
jgi:ectoine hydroxylase-related dioxygenase (phytanoyl-CoA dioxygenase family)